MLMKRSFNLVFFLFCFFAFHPLSHIAEISHSIINSGTEGGSVNRTAHSRRAISDAQSKLKEANLFISIADVTAFMSFISEG